MPNEFAVKVGFAWMQKCHVITDENAFLLLTKMPFYYWLVVCGNNILVFFWNSLCAWGRVGLANVSPAVPIFLVHDSGRKTSCVVQVNCGKIQRKNILRTPAESKVAIVGPVKGAMVMFIGTINTLLLTQSSEPQIQLVQKNLLLQ